MLKPKITASKNESEVPPSNASSCPLCLDRGEPNATTLEAIRELQEGGGMKLTGTIADLMASLDD